MANFLSCHKKSSSVKKRLSLLTIVVDFMVFHKSLCLTGNPALLAKIGKHLWGNWIPNSLWVRLDILKLMALLKMLVSQCKEYCIPTSESVFLLDIFFTHWWFLSHLLNQWDFDIFPIWSVLWISTIFNRWSNMASDWCTGFRYPSLI